VGLNRFFSVFNNSVTALNPLANDPSLGSIPGRYAPVLNVPGLTTMSGSFGATSPAGHGYTSVQAYEDAFLVRGTHALKFGFAFERMLENIYARPTLNGSFSFPSLLGFLTNTPTSVSVLNPEFSHVVGIRQSLLGGYLHDDWRWRPNLTLNLGLRYEMTTIPTESKNLFTPVQDLAGGLPVPSDHAWQTNATIRNFEPRVGFSWDPLKNGKTRCAPPSVPNRRQNSARVSVCSAEFSQPHWPTAWQRVPGWTGATNRFRPQRSYEGQKRLL
jgi:outer membrane receptor protein involved in Fe transport